jgi:H-type small acid-soluble spore protein
MYIIFVVMNNTTIKKGVGFMKLKRAEEIFNSASKINVFYRNDPVWIDNIDPNKDNVDITLLNTNTTLNVPVWDLRE